MTHSIRSQIIATGLCPLIIMSTLVSILSLKETNPMIIANVIAMVLVVGIIQLLYFANSIVKPIRKTEAYIIQIADGNLDISIDEFYQGDTSHSKEGNGLGLALTLRVLQLQESTMSVKSTPGIGTTFTVTIPVSIADNNEDERRHGEVYL
ncbi:sensor histidine kinase [[Clostridium] fimetarium]|nr:ATP-binding protein [[Clostridium] fimetarium]